MNLSEQTHLSEVVVSLLQSGELPQETLILSSLLIQLCPQSCTRLRHSLTHTLCTHTQRRREEGVWDTMWEKEAKKKKKKWERGDDFWNNADLYDASKSENLPSCAFSCSSNRAERSSLSLLKVSFSLFRASTSLKSERESAIKTLLSVRQKLKETV